MKKPWLYGLLALILVCQVAFIALLLSAATPVAMAKSIITGLNYNYDQLNPDTDLLPVQDLFGRWGYIDRQGTIVIWPKFEYANEFHEELAIIRSENKLGFIDKTGQYVIRPMYEYADDFLDGQACVKLDGKYGIIDRNGQILLLNDYTWLDYLSNGFYLFSRSKMDDSERLYGVIDSNGTVIIEPEYDSIRSSLDGEYYVLVDSHHKCSLADKQFHVILEPVYENISVCTADMIAVKTWEGWSFVYKNGNIKSPCQYLDIGTYSEGFIAVQDAETCLWGFVNASGNLAIPCQYENYNNSFTDIEITRFQDGLACIMINDYQCQLIDYTGKVIIDTFDLRGHDEYSMDDSDLENLLWNSAWIFRYGYSGDGIHWRALQKGNLVFFDNKGNTLFEADGNIAGIFSDGLCIIGKNAFLDYGDFYYIDKSGSAVTGCQYQHSGDFHNGIAEVNVHHSPGYINTKGEYIWTPDGVRLDRLKLSLLFLVVSLLTAFIIIRIYTRMSKATLSPDIDYEHLNPDIDLFIIRDRNGRFGYADRQGRIAVLPKYTEAYPFSDGVARVADYARCFYIDRFGAVPVKKQYILQLDYIKGHALVCGKGNEANGASLLWGAINHCGDEVLSPAYPTLREEAEGMHAYQDIDGKWGFLNGQFQPAIAPAYADTQDFHDGLAAVQDSQTELWGYIDRKGALVIDCRFRDTLGFSEGLAEAQHAETGLWGYIDRHGEEAIPFVYQYIENFWNGLAIAIREGEQQLSVINRNGTVVRQGGLHYGHCGQGLFWDSDGAGKLAFFNNQGATQFEADADFAGEYSEGMCAVGKTNEKGVVLYGYIDGRGNRVIDFRFRKVGPFAGGIARVEMGETPGDVFGYINTEGRFVIGSM